jgi:two-component system OmpR family response regulator
MMDAGKVYLARALEGDVAPVILVIEDDFYIATMLQTVIADEGYTVQHAATGQDGLRQLQAEGIDLVLLDIMLPDMDGREVCRQIRAEPRDEYVPVIMLTALVGAVATRRGFAAGADDYIAKPFNVGELLDLVNAWIRVRRYFRGDPSALADEPST